MEELELAEPGGGRGADPLHPRRASATPTCTWRPADLGPAADGPRPRGRRSRRRGRAGRDARQGARRSRRLLVIPNCGPAAAAPPVSRPICDWARPRCGGTCPARAGPISGPRGRYGAMCCSARSASPGSSIRTPRCGRRRPPARQGRARRLRRATGWGSAMNAADVRPGDVVMVTGVGGIGINAVQGARFAGGRSPSSRSIRWRSSGRRP